MAQPPAIEKLLLAVSRRGRVIVRFSGKGCGGKSRPSTSSSLSNPLGGLRSFFDTTTNVWAFFVAKRLFWSPSNLQARSSGRHRGIKEAFFLLLLILWQALPHLLRLLPLLCVNWMENGPGDRFMSGEASNSEKGLPTSKAEIRVRPQQQRHHERPKPQFYQCVVATIGCLPQPLLPFLAVVSEGIRLLLFLASSSLYDIGGGRGSFWD